MIAGVREYVEISDGGLTIVDRNGARRTIEADTIVLALPLQPNTALFGACHGKVREVYAVGDCKAPQLIVDAVGTGLLVARAV
jgi:thioredoxin reductase